MAVVIISEPQGFNAINRLVEWIVSLDDVGSGNLEKRLYYQLFDENDVPITVEESLVVKVNEQVTLNFSDSVKNILRTSIPKINVYVGVDSLFRKKIKLKVGEVIIDRDNCSVTKSFSYTSPLISVGNVLLQEYDNYIPQILSNKPNELYHCRGTRDFVWLRDGVSVSSTYYMRDVNGVNVQVVSGANINHEIAYIALHPYHLSHPDLERIYKAEIEITLQSGFGVRNYTVYFDDCCDKPFAEIYFKNNLGGWDCVVFDEVSGLSVEFEFREIYSYTPHRRFVGAGGDWRFNESDNGFGVFGKRSKERLTGVTRWDNSRENIEFFKSFFSSPEHFVSFRKGNVFQFRKFLLDGGGINYYSEDEIEVQISGYFSHLVR